MNFALFALGCRQTVLQKIGSEEAWKRQMHYLAYKIHFEMVEQYNKGFLSGTTNRDLFVEQIVLCQMLGVVNCFDSKYLSLLIKWQHNSGCWKMPENDAPQDVRTQDVNEGTKRVIEKYYEQEDNILIRYLPIHCYLIG